MENFHRKYLKYKKKYVELVKQYGGASKTNKTYEELRDMLLLLKTNRNMGENYIRYMQNKILKLDELIRINQSKASDDILIDEQNRNKLASTFIDKMIHKAYEGITSQSCVQQDATNIKACYELDLLQKYADAIKQTGAIISDTLGKRMNIEKLISIKTMYEQKLRDFAAINPNNYIDEIIQFCDINTSPPFNKYKIELLEFLIVVLNGTVEIEGEPFNIIITGPPGVGKSFLAKQIAKLLELTKLLPSGDLINVKKPDVIGQYVGQTAPKTYNILTSAIGKIVFIDEAYSFAGAKTGSGYNSFGKEFIDAMVDFITEHKGLISIIAAGYKKEMDEQFIQVNSGINRRFPVKLEIERYSGDEIFNAIVDITKVYEHAFMTFYERTHGVPLNDVGVMPRYRSYMSKIYVSFANFMYYIQFNIQRNPLSLLNDIVDTAMPIQFAQYFNFYDDDGFNVRVPYNENILTRFFLAAILEKCGVKYGDLINNQMSDIVELYNIIKIVLTMERDFENAYLNIFKSYIIYKTQFKYETDFIFVNDGSEHHLLQIRIKGEYKRAIKDLLQAYSTFPPHQFINDMIHIQGNGESQHLRNQLISLCDSLIETSRFNSDYSLFTMDELASIKTMLIHPPPPAPTSPQIPTFPPAQVANLSPQSPPTQAQVSKPPPQPTQAQVSKPPPQPTQAPVAKPPPQPTQAPVAKPPPQPTQVLTLEPAPQYHRYRDPTTKTKTNPGLDPSLAFLPDDSDDDF